MHRKDPKYAQLICPVDGRITITEGEYTYQMDRPDSRWRCPKCGDDCHFDDEYFESRHLEPSGGPLWASLDDLPPMPPFTGDE